MSHSPFTDRLAIFRENNDCFVVRATNRSSATERRYFLRVIAVECHDPLHGKHWMPGEEFDVSRAIDIPKSLEAYCPNWTLTTLEGHSL